MARMERWQNKVPASVGSAFEMSGFPTMFLVLQDCRYKYIYICIDIDIDICKYVYIYIYMYTYI